MAGKDLTILSPGTFIRGDLFSADVLVIEGGVEGNIRGDRVIVKPRGWIHGDVTCRSLSIEPGGLVDGTVKVEAKTDIKIPAMAESFQLAQASGSPALPPIVEAETREES